MANRTSFKKGHKFAKGGSRPNSGRPKKEYTDKSSDAKAIYLKNLDTENAAKFLSDVWSGKPVEEIANPKYDANKNNGEPPTIKVSASIRDRIVALKEHNDRALGRPAQAIDHGLQDKTIDIVKLVMDAGKERGLPPLE